MFSFFRRRKTGQDQLSDLRTVSRWMQELPAGDIYTAQEQVVQSLIQFNHARLPMSKERLQVLMHLDEQARDMQFSLCTQYLRNPRMSKVIESRLWTAVHAFYWEVTRGYHAFLMDFVSNPGGSRIQSSVPLIAARTLRGFAEIFKWRYFRYEKIEEKLWLRMHNLYRIAEFDNFQGEEIKVYGHDAKQSSCTDEYVQALILSPLGAGSLTPRQIEMVDQWLDNWSTKLKLETVFNADHHLFYVDTAKGQGLRRIRSECEATCRFLSTETLIEHIESVKRSLKSGSTPVSLGLGEEFRLPDGYELLEYVEGEWSSGGNRERRASARNGAEGRWQVIRDLASICSHIQAELETAAGISARPTLSPEEILDIKLYGFVTERTKTSVQQRASATSRAELIEHWVLKDRSEAGLGFLVRNDDSEWIKVGKLLALRPDSGESWHLAVVRRIGRVDEEWRTIGIEVITQQAQLVFIEAETGITLSYSVDDRGMGDGGQATPGLQFSDDASDFVIMESAGYAHGKLCRLRTHDAIQRIRLDAVRDKGDGWLMASYFVTQ
jgi:cyclic-di-GMP-binding protein